MARSPGVRGIYEGYLGWFDENPASMYETPVAAVYPDLVALAGGGDSVAKRAAEYVAQGDPIRALHVSDIALSSEPTNRTALQVRLTALHMLRAKATNTNEQGWLDSGIRETKARLGE